MSKNLLRGGVGLLFAAALAATAAEPQTIEVRLGNFYIKPDRITAKAGQPVTLNLVNEEGFFPTHDLVIQAPEAGIDIKVDVPAGKRVSVSFTPTKPGSYEMYCSKQPPFLASHREKGMHGTLEVVP
jgi:uncharacterized cupredoxin-like copper-binding protein